MRGIRDKTVCVLVSYSIVFFHISDTYRQHPQSSPPGVFKAVLKVTHKVKVCRGKELFILQLSFAFDMSR